MAAAVLSPSNPSRGLYSLPSASPAMNAASISAFLSDPWGTIGPSVGPMVETMQKMGRDPVGHITAKLNGYHSGFSSESDPFLSSFADDADDRAPSRRESHLAAAGSRKGPSASPPASTVANDSPESVKSQLTLVNEEDGRPLRQHPTTPQQQQQQQQHTANAMQPSSSTPEPLAAFEEEDNITFYQGFRASHPRMAKPRQVALSTASSMNASKRLSFPLGNASGILSFGQMLLASAFWLPAARAKPRLAIAGPSTSSTSSTSTAPSQPQSQPQPHTAGRAGPHAQLPEKARHQATALNNITRIFSELLSERDDLLVESDDLESKRKLYMRQLRDIESALTELNAKKHQIASELRGVVEREEKIAQLVDDLDERIASISDQTVRVERTIRHISSDDEGSASAALQLIDEVETAVQAVPNTCIKTLFGHTDSVECVDFETTRGMMVSGSADKTIRVWDLASHRCVGVLTGHTGWVRAVQMAGQTVMSGSGDHTVRRWDLSRMDAFEDVTERHAQQQRKQQQQQQALEPRRRMLLLEAPPSASGSSSSTRVPSPSHYHRDQDGDDDDELDGTMRLSGPHVQTYEGHTAGVSCLMFDDQFLLTGSADKTVRHWDMATGKTLAVLRTDDPDWLVAPPLLDRIEDPAMAAWATSQPDDDYAMGGVGAGLSVSALASSSSSGSSVSTPFVTAMNEPEFDGWATRETATPTSTPMTLDDLVNQSSSLSSMFPASPVASSPAFAAGSPSFISASAHMSASRTRGSVYGSGRYSMSVSSSSAAAAAAPVTPTAVHSLHFWQFALAAGYGDGVVRLWDLRTARCHRELKGGHVGPVTGVRFDDHQVVSGGSDRTVKIWDLRAGQVLETVALDGPVSAVSMDATRIAVACGGKDVMLLRRRDGVPGQPVPVSVLGAHTKPVRGVKVVGDTLVSGGMDSTVRVWSVDV
ncbi:WD40-repeat-containing domain protein [Entophlyctis helioformis]|nr:WD40-repeat-containing domain protein [Entophlyctis helioformis]